MEHSQNSSATPQSASTHPAQQNDANQLLGNLIKDLLHERSEARQEKKKMQRRQRIRRWIFGGVIALFLLIYFVDLWMPLENTTAHTALIDIQGEISAESDAASADAVTAALQAAFEEKHVHGIILRINSPGGSPVQAGIIYDEIKRLQKLYPKPIYAVAEEVCASAAYYIAASTDKIFVNQASIVGSIGVLMNGFGFTDAMKKMGVERRLLVSGENKGFLDPFSPQSARHTTYAKEMLTKVHAQFIKAVKDGRGQRLKVKPDTFSGLFWDGEQAVAMGLADGLGNIHYVAREILDVPTIIDYTVQDSVTQKISKSLGMAIGDAAIAALKSSLGAPSLR